ncbi:HAD family hydrolase [Kitasatospora sp. CM 4170]|uniref:HAD family hydrolase n=1 Tax=Kitasatospora aburaviensis TaxID=67265 RepID=A0ABW1EQQ1_9ACTN|nr:HAD family hydrolase [Kitasatospora sp. CM 4170]WNM44677.1 HAD family hydrolase [Kitasatospora sp. CM 4170]
MTTAATPAGPEPAHGAADAPAGVVFDLDGTLVDSWALHLRCLRRSLHAAGLPEPSAARLAAAQRPTDAQTLAALVPPDLLDEAALGYDRELRRLLAEEPTDRLAMPGARRTVAALRAAGLTLGICTGRSRAHAQALLDAAGLAIGLTVAREDAAHPKPAADGLLLALRRLGLTPDRARYVGDSPADARQGAAAGVPTLLLRPGGGPPADGTLRSLHDLPAVLRKAGP